jgi:prevent-host-death family protein
MGSITIRELSRRTSAVVSDVARTGRPTLVTRHGAPVVAVVPIDEAELEDFILSGTPSFADDLAEAQRAIAGGKTRPADAVFDEDHGAR